MMPVVRLPWMLACLVVLPVSAQSSRFGLGLSVLRPQGVASAHYRDGGDLAIQVYFHHAPWVQGRFHVDLFQLPGKPFQTLEPGLPETRTEARGARIGYEWLPSFTGEYGPGLYGIVGVGGVRWSQEIQVKTASPDSYRVDDREDHTSFAFTFGVGLRFTQHFSVELRHSEVRKDRIHFSGPDERFVDAGVSHTALGVALRF